MTIKIGLSTSTIPEERFKEMVQYLCVQKLEERLKRRAVREYVRLFLGIEPKYTRDFMVWEYIKNRTKSREEATLHYIKQKYDCKNG